MQEQQQQGGGGNVTKQQALAVPEQPRGGMMEAAERKGLTARLH